MENLQRLEKHFVEELAEQRVSTQQRHAQEMQALMESNEQQLTDQRQVRVQHEKGVAAVLSALSTELRAVEAMEQKAREECRHVQQTMEAALRYEREERAKKGKEEFDSAVNHAIEKRKLEAAMQDLTPDQRACISLCLAGGWSHGEAAEALDMPVGTIKSHIKRGRARLLAVLGGDS